MSDDNSGDPEYSPFTSGGSQPPEAPVPGPRRAMSAPGRPKTTGVRVGRVLLVAFVVLFGVVATAVGYFGYQLNSSVSSITRETAAMPTGSRPPSATSTIPANNAPMNILLIGSDSRGSDTGRSDTFIVLHLDADRKNVYLVSFPRDMWVSIPGYGQAKINAAYSYGKTSLAVATIENLTGARIDHTVVTDFTDFMSLVDTVGPVTVDNPVGSTAIDDRGVKYKFPKGPLTITDGRMALAFVRQREELPNGDLDRTLRQRAFLKALALKVATPEVLANPVKLNQVISTVGKFVTVDSQMTNDLIYSLAISLTGITSGSQIHMVMAPITGFGTSADGQSIDVVDKAGVSALGKALQNDTMAAYVASHPSTEYGYSPAPSATTSGTAKPSAGATKS